MDEVCSVIYNAYDLAMGFVVANEKVAREAATILDYEPSADLAQFKAEHNIAQVTNQANGASAISDKYFSMFNFHAIYPHFS